MHATAACTIVSKNYFAYALVLANSFKTHNPSSHFYILVVDRATDRQRFTCSDAKVLFLEDLGIADCLHRTFKFDIVELNTNVKPSLLKWVLGEGHQGVYYFDPDILCYTPTEWLDGQLAGSNLILTPHSTAPYPEADGCRPIDRDLLKCGVYNLGFIGVNNTDEGLRFLTWWENRCLEQGFNEPALGMFVDQHWIDLAPCYFQGVRILKHRGCNVAYWNLHERQVVIGADKAYSVSSTAGLEPLQFFHFSGISPRHPEAVSKHQNRITLKRRPDLAPLFNDYAARLLAANYENYQREEYGFGKFEDGSPISALMRRYYAELPQLHCTNPFGVDSKAYRFAKRLKLTQSSAPEMKLTSMSAESGTDWRLRAAGRLMRGLLSLAGGQKFELIAKFMRYYGIPQNHAQLMFHTAKKDAESDS